MKEIFELAGAIIFSLGGGSVIVFALSNWLGKVWANRILETEKAEHLKEIEKYKSRLDVELQRYNFLNDKATFISKKQYEMEFKIYLEIWERLVDLSNMTLELFPLFDVLPSDEEKCIQFRLDRYTNYVESYNQYLSLTKKYLPFYEKELGEHFREFRKLCYEQGTTYDVHVVEPLKKHKKDWLFNLSKEESIKAKRENPKKIQELENNIAEIVRCYLISLQELSI